MSEVKLNPEEDILIDLDDLQEEFRMLPVLMYRYSETRANAGHEADLAEAKYKETKAKIFKQIIRESDKKPSDKVIEAEIESNKEVKQAKLEYLETKRDYETIKGFVESLRMKKDMLIQIGADARKE